MTTTALVPQFSSRDSLYTPPSTRTVAVRDYLMYRLFKGKFPVEIICRITCFVPQGVPVNSKAWRNLTRLDQFLNFIHRLPLFRALQSGLNNPSSQPKVLHSQFMAASAALGETFPYALTRQDSAVDLPIHPQVARMRVQKEAMMFLSEIYTGDEDNHLFLKGTLSHAKRITSGVITYPLLGSIDTWNGIIGPMTIFPKEKGQFLRVIEFVNTKGVVYTFCGWMVSSRVENTSLFYLPIHRDRSAGQHYPAYEKFSWVFTIFSYNKQLSSEYLRRHCDNPFLDHRLKQMLSMSIDLSIADFSPPRLALMRSASTGRLTSPRSPSGRDSVVIASGRCTPNPLPANPLKTKMTTAIATLT